jgi:hypothetical protein
MLWSTPSVSAPAPVFLAGLGLLGLPFDALRLHYAACVQTGLVRRSLLDSRDVEHAVNALEQLTMGPLARRT